MSPDDELTGLLAELLGRPGGGLLLDLDGTLVDSEHVHRQAYRDYFAARGWTVGDDAVLAFSGRRAAEVFATFDGPWTGEDPDELTEGVLDALRRTVLEPRAVPGAAATLAACLRTDVPVAVVTSARLEWTLPALEMLGADTRAGIRLVTAEDCTHGKPDPEPYRHGAELLGLDPARLVAVEDAPPGIASALAAGVGHVLGVTTTHAAGALATAGAGSTATDLTPLARALGSRSGHPA
ncbi:HAD family phosphatase [Sanguibacter sp. 25GB23B1]|uniref:HAD family hydrolase n=1 Tax=unclassified Sanguibacter TaxID=2645534 RepID=UPI0032AFA6E4